MVRLVGLCLSCFCSTLIKNAVAETPPEVTVVQPAVREVIDYGDFRGRAEAVQSVDVRSRVTGQLAKIAFKAGSVVQQGDLLFEMDSRMQQAALEKFEGEMAFAQAKLKRAEATLRRYEELDKTTPGAVWAFALDEYRLEVDAARVAVPFVKANLEIARLQLDLTRVRAPISGKIGQPALGVGNIVTADTTPLTTIVSTDPVYVYFDVDERTALLLRRKALENRGKDEGKSTLPVSCSLIDEAGFPRRGVVDFANNQVEPATSALRMRAVLPNGDGLIIPGMSIRVRLALSGPYKAVVLPDRVLSSGQGVRQVFVVTTANVIERRTVKLGPLDDGMRVVREGLSAGDNVVVGGAQRLRPGMTVTVKKIP